MVAAADDKISDEDVAVIERSACPTCGSCSGMFTANSMNCLTEALGLSLPGNGSTLATHSDRKGLFLEAGRRIVDLAKRYYEQDDETACHAPSPVRAPSKTPWRSISPWAARPTPCCTFWPPRMRARSISPWMTSTACRAACPCLSKVAPAKADVHMEDVHRAGGIMAILGELTAPACSTSICRPCTRPTMREALAQWDVAVTDNKAALELFSAAPGGVPTQVAFSQSARWEELDLDREKGVIRDAQHPFSKDGGLAVLKGNLRSTAAS
jgi:dihydroxy-acid dehydratase